MAGYVLYEQKAAVAYITLNRPERMNALGHDLRRELMDAFSTVRQDPSVRVAVITGAGNRAFSAGGDLKEHKEIFDRKRVRVGPDYGALDEPPNSSTLALETYKPTIAAVNGYALAGGCELALLRYPHRLGERVLCADRSDRGPRGEFRFGHAPVSCAPWFGDADAAYRGTALGVGGATGWSGQSSGFSGGPGLDGGGFSGKNRTKRAGVIAAD